MVGQGRNCEQSAVGSFPHRPADSSRYKCESQWGLRYVPLWPQVVSGWPSFFGDPAAEWAPDGFPCPLLPFEAASPRVPGLAPSLIKCQSQPECTAQPSMLGSEEVAHVLLGPGPAAWVQRVSEQPQAQPPPCCLSQTWVWCEKSGLG